VERVVETPPVADGDAASTHAVPDTPAEAVDVDAPVRFTHIGGQAVIEGVMMRGKLNWAVAVRRADEQIHVEEHALRSAAATRPYLRWPIVRGVWGLWETLSLAMKAFGISASVAGVTEEDDDAGLSAKEVTVTIILGIGLAVGLFIVLPAVATNLLGETVRESTFWWNLIDGIIRIAIFFLYIWVVSRMRDIQRVFAYHGAEHKTIHAYERGLPLRPDIIQRYETLHVRCGTSFLLMVMVIAILVFSLVPADTLATRVASRIVLLPLIAGLAYEVIKLAGKYPENPFIKVLLWPGLQLQRMTTREPDDDMIEVAVEAMARVVERETGAPPAGYTPAAGLIERDATGEVEQAAEGAASAADRDASGTKGSTLQAP
jgi:uncharacterized protein YqhQ